MSTERRLAGIKQGARISRLGERPIVLEHSTGKRIWLQCLTFSYMRGLRVYSSSNFLMPPRKPLVEICFHLQEDWKNRGQAVTEHLAIRKRVQRKGNCSSSI